MARIGIYFGSDSGNTQHIANELAKALNVDNSDIHDVAKSNTDFSAYDVLLFGSSTMGFGDLQDDWDSYIDDVKNVDLSGKKVAIFGCGDSQSYCDTFCDAVGTIYQAVKDKCEVIGIVDIEGYSFDESAAIVDGKSVGLLIDEDNEADMTAQRIADWIEILKKEI